MKIMDGDAENGSMSEAYDGSTAVAAPRPQSRFVVPSMQSSQPRESQSKMPDLTLKNAYKLIKFYQDEPQWLADPRTMHAANADFAQASKIIGMNMQLERLQVANETARAKNSMAKQVGTSLLKLAESGAEGAKIAAKWYATDDEGKPLYENAANWKGILEDYQTHTKPVADVKRPTADTLTFSDGKTVNVVYGPSGAPTIIKDGKPADDAAQKALGQVATADLLDARKGIHRASTIQEREAALKAYDSAKRNFDTVFGIQKQTPAAPQAQPASPTQTNAPGAIRYELRDGQLMQVQ